MQRILDMNFGAFTFHALGYITPAALLEERTGLGCRSRRERRIQRKDRVCYCGGPALPLCAPGDSRRASAPPVLHHLGSVSL